MDGGKTNFGQFAVRLGALMGLDIAPDVNPYDGLYDDLGLDSVQAFEMLIIIESLAGNVVPPENVPELFTLADAFEYFESLKAMA